MPNLRSMIDGTMLFGAPPVPIKSSPVATGGSSATNVPATGQPSAAAKHVSDHVQDPVGATKDGFSKLQEAKLEYDKQRSDMALQLLPVQSVLDHVSQNHGIMNNDDPNAVDEMGQPINPGAGMSTGMQPGAVPGKGMPPAKPGMPGTPGLAPSMGQTRPPALGQPQPGAVNKPGMAQPSQGAAPKPAAGGAKKSKPGATGPGAGKGGNAKGGKGVEVHVTASSLHNEVLSGATNNLEASLAYGRMKAGKVLHSGKSRLNAMTPGSNGTTGMEFDASKVIRTCAKCGKMHASEDGCKGMQAGGPGSGRRPGSSPRTGAEAYQQANPKEAAETADRNKQALDKAADKLSKMKASEKGQGETFHMGDKPKDDDQFFEKMRDKMTIRVDQSSGKIKSPMAAGRLSDCEDECDDDEDCMDDCLDMAAGGPGSGRHPGSGKGTSEKPYTLSPKGSLGLLRGGFQKGIKMATKAGEPRLAALLQKIHDHVSAGKPIKDSHIEKLENHAERLESKAGNVMNKLDYDNNLSNKSANNIEKQGGRLQDLASHVGRLSDDLYQHREHFSDLAAADDCDCVKAAGSRDAAIKGWGTRGRGKPHASASAKELDAMKKKKKRMYSGGPGSGRKKSDSDALREVMDDNRATRRSEKEDSMIDRMARQQTKRGFQASGRKPYLSSV